MAVKKKRLCSGKGVMGAEFEISLDDLKVRARNKILKDCGNRPNEDNIGGVSVYIYWFKEGET